MPSIIRRMSDRCGTTEGTPELARRPALPNLVIIGAMKGGTTSLHRYLNLHPAASMARGKELNFFIETHAWRRGINWYAAQFDATAEVRGESSPDYTACHVFPGVPARMAHVIPGAKLIYIVRDPIERLISQYVHNLNHGRERRAFADVCREMRYLSRSMYWFQISKYLEHFEASRILVVEANDLRDRRRDAMRRIFDFVGVQPEFYSSSFRSEHHVSAQKRQKTDLGLRFERSVFGRWIERLPEPWRRRISSRIYLPLSRPIERPTLTTQQRLELAECLHDDAMRFRAWTGRQFPRWSV